MNRIVNVSVRYRYLLACVLFAALVMGKVHGSSLSMWDEYIGEKTDLSGSTLLLGQPRAIRSDEWLIQTPFYLSQAESKKFFPRVNPNIRSDGQNMLLVSAPVFDLTLIGKPFNWGFILFGNGYGLSWYWYSKVLLLFLLSFEISMLLSDGNIPLSVIGAFWITYSPAMQWWFSCFPEYLIYSQAMIAATWHYLKTQNRVLKSLLAFVFAGSAVGYTLTLNPPVQVPMGFMTMIFFAFLLYAKRGQAALRPYDYGLFVAVAGIAAGSIYSYIVTSWDALQILGNTVYPGKRFITGGGFDINFLQLYLIDWLLPYKDATFLNNCEASTYLNLLPAIVVAIVVCKIYKFEENKKALVAALLAYLMFQISWLVVSYPSWFAEYTLFSRVTEKRLHMTVGLTALYLSIWGFSILSKYRPLSWRSAAGLSALIMVLYYYSLVNTPMAGYLQLITGGMLITLFFFFVLNFAFLSGMKRLFYVCLLIYICVAGLPVNPISRGLAPIYGKAVAQKVLQIRERDPEAKWMSLNGLELGNYLVALGVKTFNSIHFYPDLKAWTSLDPAGTDSAVYNRYGYADVSTTNLPTHFVLLKDDWFVLFLNGGDLWKTGVTYVLSRGKSFEHLLREIDSVPSDDLYIYEVIR